MIWAAVSALARASCPSAGSEGVAATIEQLVEASFDAWEDLDQERFDAAESALPPLVACLDAPVGPDLAARLHVARLLDAWWRRQDPTALAAEARAVALSRDASELAADLVASGSEIDLSLRAAKAAYPDDAVPLPGSARASWRVDGLPARFAPVARAELLQRTTRTGTESWYLDHGGLPAEPDLGRGPRVPTVLAAEGCTAVAAGAFFSAAALIKGQVVGGAGDPAVLVPANHALVAAGLGAATAAGAGLVLTVAGGIR